MDMFTGIVEEIGVIRSVRRGAHSSVLSIEASLVLSDLQIGDSVAVNGVCLTVVFKDQRGFGADVTRETLNRSALGRLTAGSHVNLERAMVSGGRFGGHMVLGHIDGIGTVAAVRRDDNAFWFTIQADESILRYVVEKGSIAIDGISLTVSSVDANRFSVSVIPHTAASTCFLERRPGDVVNLETDIIGKYVEKLLPPHGEVRKRSEVSRDFLLQNGF